ncbi:hypothetical protein [Dactylosporangium darangshiense]|uniref:Serine/threonine protein kinase n=1 Tax=Dactylosporangium darangshiense TaxID=579108 RepID=A0ABP8DMZ3_9ACTN
MSWSRPRLIAGLAAVTLVIAGGLVWWFGPFRDRPWVPTCTDVAPGLQTELGGTWTVTDPDEGRAKGKHQSTSRCTIAFVTADQKYTGTLDLFTVVALDPDAGSKDVASAQCGVTDKHVEVPQGYHAFRLCSQTNSTQTFVTVWAAKNDRWGTASVTINLRDNEQAATTYANDLSRLAAKKALTMSEPA